MQAVVPNTRAAGGFFRSLIRELVLCADPSVEIFLAVYRDAQKHLGMLRSAILAHWPRYTPVWRGSIHVSLTRLGIQVGLARQLGNPKTVIGVGERGNFRNVGAG